MARLSVRRGGRFCYNGKMTAFILNSQLARDTHELLNCDEFMVLLHRNKTLPWFIVVPKTSVTEWFDLSPEKQVKLGNLLRKLGLFLQQNQQCDKVNTASIGNVVSQLHIHVIGRYLNDPLWPDVVWGNELPKTEYHVQDLTNLHQELRQALDIL